MNNNEQNRIDSIEAHLAKIRLRLKAHRAVDLEQINQMSDEICSLLGLSSTLNKSASTDKIQHKGAFVSSTLEQMRQLLWEQDHAYLKEIDSIIFYLHELVYSIPFEEPAKVDKKLQELTQNLSSLVQTMTIFSPRVEEKIKKAYAKLQDVHFLLQFPICLELKKDFYFPNFYQQINSIIKADEKKELIAALSAKQQKEIKRLKTPQAFLQELKRIYALAKAAFFGQKSDAKILQELDKDLQKKIESGQVAGSLISYLEEIILS